MLTITMILSTLWLAAPPSGLELITVDPKSPGFTLKPSGQTFVPWGMNYPAGDRFQEEDWYPADKLSGDFEEMKRLGANVVRVHLEMAFYMESPERFTQRGLDQFERLLGVAEQTGLYLDVTGLACYRPKDAMPWYDQLSESDRWTCQARFWEEIAKRGAKSKAIFCYDLINEPIVAGSRRDPGKWCSGNLFGGCDFVQFINLDPAGRPRHEIAIAWIRQLTAAIRKHDSHRLITVGMLPSTPAWGHFSGFLPEKIAPEVDFLAVHIYPDKGKVEEALKITRGFAVGKPLVIEETYSLNCGPEELKEYMLKSRTMATGWIGHYFGERWEELDAQNQQGKLAMMDSFRYHWLTVFRDLGTEMKHTAGTRPAQP